MIVRPVKVLFLAVVFATAGNTFAAYADPPSTNHASNGVAALHSQIIQSAALLLAESLQDIKLADIQSILTLAQKYFSSRKKIEWPLFNRRLEDLRFHRFNDHSLYQEPQPSMEETLIAVFRQYISAHPLTSQARNSVASLTQLRNLLRQLQAFGDGHLSGYTWLYNSHLPVFAAQQLKLLDQQIVESSFSSANTLRKKHQYAAAEKIYKNLLADYSKTPHAAQIKVRKV